MNQQQKLSTNKIVALLILLCAAIITILFSFRISHASEANLLDPAVGTLFTVPRDIKPFKLVAAPMPGHAFSEKNLLNHWTLVFFGFTHCATVCPPTLVKLSDIYQSLHPKIPNLQVVFISLDPTRDSLDKLNRYTRQFNKGFMGVSGKIQELRKLQSQLGVFAARDENNQIQHTASILLINPQGKWSGLLSDAKPAEVLTKALKTSINTYNVMAQKK
ncbi:MAG: SCO family protein [Gammaproteobacteria bacterium]